MRILFITTGFPPYEFSENIINGKLVLALSKEGHDIKVISKIDDGPTYSTIWREPWLNLEPITHFISYPRGDYFIRIYDILKDIFIYKYPIDGLRWADRAYKKSIEIINEGEIDLIMTRSPSDIAHLVGLKIKNKYKIKWIANWNDPATGIWPLPYEPNLSILKKFVYKSFTKEVLESADINTFPSKLLCTHFSEHFDLDLNHTKIIPHIYLSDYKIINMKPRTGCLNICHSGNFSEERNPRNLLAAIKKFISNKNKNIFLDVLGFVANGILAQVEEYNLQSNINFLAPLPYFEALRKMQEYDVLMILEAQTGRGIFLPSKITDYAQLKIPILALTPIGSEVDTVLHRYAGGIVANNESMEDIYDKLCLLDNLKFTNNLSHLTENSTLDDYLGSPRIVNEYHDLFTLLD